MARKLDRMLIIDIESTCWDGAPPEGQTNEIIEIGVCPVDVQTLQRIGKHSLLVKSLRSTISRFCTELTTLTPDMFTLAGTLANAVQTLKREFGSKDRLWASWGDYDRRQFERVCAEAEIGYPFGPSHLNVKSLFVVTYGLSSEVGLDGACQKLGMTMQGTHHRGDDDAWNIAAILCDLLRSLRTTVPLP